MALLSAFVPAVMIEADQAPLPVVEAMILRAAAEFCEQSLVWAAWSDPLAFEENVPEYELEIPNGARLVTVRELWAGNLKMVPSDAVRISREVPGWQTASGSPSHFMLSELSPPTVRFYAMPNATEAGNTFTARLIFAPSSSATSLPDFLDERYRYEIADGAKAFLMALPRKPWSDPQRAAQLEALFRQHKSRARISSEHGHVHKPSVVQSREFGRP